MGTFKLKRKTSAGLEEIKIPYSAIADPPSNIVTTDGAQTIKGSKTFSSANTFTAETKFTHSTYAPEFTDIAQGIGKSSCFTRGAFMQAIAGQILAPNTSYTEAGKGYSVEANKIKFQKMVASNGQPTVTDMAVISETGMSLGTKTVATTDQIPDISGKANLSGGNTFSGVQIVNAPTNISGTEQTTAKFKTSNGGSIMFGKEAENSGTMIRLDQTDGTCRLRFRSSATAGAMVWEQPEKGAQLYIDLGLAGTDKHRITFPSSAGTLALTSQVPTSTTVAGWGFTKNAGTVTSVKVNSSTYSPDSSGTVDLGTISAGGTSDSSKHGYTQLTNENLNTITDVGWYCAASDNTCTNKPITTAVPFVLEIEKSADALKQTLYQTGNSEVTYYTSYVRYSLDSGSTWKAWATQQTLSGNLAQTFSGRKTFSSGIGLGSSIYTNGSYGSSSQVLMSQGSSSSPKWTNLKVKVNGTTYTADSSGLVDLGTISGGTTVASVYNSIY